MTKFLLLVAGVGFAVCIACFSAVAAMGGLNLSRQSWGWDSRHGPPIHGDGPMTERTLAWKGGDSLTVNVQAEVEYAQGPDATLVITGPKGAVDNLRLDGDTLTYDRRMRSWPRLKIVMIAPGVSEFTLNGSQRLTITGYDQRSLEVSIHGSGDVTAAGRADEVELTIAGSGDADLAWLDARSAQVNVAGSGKAVIAPRDKAEVNIAGSGDVVLTTDPPQVETNIVGSGKIVRREKAVPAGAARI